MRDRSLLFVLASMALMSLALPVAAESPSTENVLYGYAQVLRADPVYERELIIEQVEQCEGDPTAGDRVRIRGAGTAPAASRVVRERLARRAAGGGEGGGEDDQGEPAMPTGCAFVEIDREINRLAGFDVEYRYRGEVFMSRVPRDPGDRMRVRVSIAPAFDVEPR